MSNPWKQIDSNRDLQLWEATAASGVVFRVPANGQPPAFILEAHAERYGNEPPQVELGERGFRVLLPGNQWREYSFTPRVLS